MKAKIRISLLIILLALTTCGFKRIDIVRVGAGEVAIGGWIENQVNQQVEYAKMRILDSIINWLVNHPWIFIILLVIVLYVLSKMSNVLLEIIHTLKIIIINIIALIKKVFKIGNSSLKGAKKVTGLSLKGAKKVTESSLKGAKKIGGSIKSVASNSTIPTSIKTYLSERANREKYDDSPLSVGNIINDSSGTLFIFDGKKYKLNDDIILVYDDEGFNIVYIFTMDDSGGIFVSDADGNYLYTDNETIFNDFYKLLKDSSSGGN